MKLPYGISDFRALREQGNLYIDKTRYIERLENFNSKYVFFIRPRRFGKSLFLSTLEHYYDINTKTDFDMLFGDLYIGQNPTPLRNSYLVLQIDFSGLNAEDRHSLRTSFNKRLTIGITSFIKKYQQHFSDSKALINAIDACNDAGIMIDLLVSAIKETDKKLYLIIDEYDNFANDLIAMGDGEFYKGIIRASGFVREFYKTIKLGTKTVIDRIFITGTSPVMLDDLTSGFNIAANLTMHENLNEMLGFTHKELEDIIERLRLDNNTIGDSLVEYYNGYLFNPDCDKRVYNPDMILYYFDHYTITKKPPRELIDDNIKTDYSKLERLVGNEENRKILDDIIRNEGITASIATKFSFDRMYDTDYFVSLLFYMGMLTIDRIERTRLLLKMPNYVIKTVYWEYVGKSLKEKYKISFNEDLLKRSVECMAYDGKIDPYINYVSGSVLKHLSNRDLREFGEKYVKIIMFTCLVNAGIYKPVSEREVENGYIDIYLERDIRVQDIKYEWLIEIKYLKKSEKVKLEGVKQEGMEQLTRYAVSRGVVGREGIKKVLVVFIGKDTYEIVESGNGDDSSVHSEG